MVTNQEIKEIKAVIANKAGPQKWGGSFDHYSLEDAKKIKYHVTFEGQGNIVEAVVSNRRDVYLTFKWVIV
jgi:hypothetical protein